MASSFLKAAMLRHLRVPAAQALTLTGRCLRSISSTSQQHYDDEEVTSAAMDILQSNHNNKCVKSLMLLVPEHPKVQLYSANQTFRVRVLSALLDFLQQDPQVSQYWIFIGRCTVRMFASTGTEDLTKDQVTSKVLDIVRSYAKSYGSKVTEEAYFCKDLGFFEADEALILHAFKMEFKLLIPEEDYSKFSSCKSSADYIYNHLSERVPMTEFMKIMYPSVKV